MPWSYSRRRPAQLLEIDASLMPLKTEVDVDSGTYTVEVCWLTAASFKNSYLFSQIRENAAGHVWMNLSMFSEHVMEKDPLQQDRAYQQFLDVAINQNLYTMSEVDR